MGLLQRAIETYDANTALIGVYRDGHEPLAPIGHILTSANIEITLNAQGKFLAARKVDKKEPKILIPVTEESSGRTSGLAAHPLCDQLKYVANTNKEAHELYLTALRKWERSAYAHPFLNLGRLQLQGRIPLDPVLLIKILKQSTDRCYISGDRRGSELSSLHIAEIAFQLQFSYISDIIDPTIRKIHCHLLQVSLVGYFCIM